METGKAIYKLLKDSVSVGAICGDRIYPELAQQDAVTPFIVYTVTDTTPSGTKNATSKLDTARVELYCIADDYETGMSLGIEVRSALDRQSGTINGVEVQSIDFDTSDIQFEPDQRFYILEQTYDVRIQRTGTAVSVAQFPGNTFTVEEVDGDPSGAVNKLVVSNGALSISGNTATITTGGGAFTDLSDTPGTLGTVGQVVAVASGGTTLEFVDQSGADVQYHDRYSTEAESERSGATATLEIYYTARPDGDGYAESEVSDSGVTDTINRTLYYSTKFQADPDTAEDWTEYTTQPANNATFATAKAALLAGLNETDATAETRGTLPLSLKMVRTTTAAAGDLLLDTYTGAAAAYSVRKLDKDYTGYCMKVRRASDDAEADIGFDINGDLDTSAIATHCGASAGYVSVWYDMSGNSNNATQSTVGRQPQIYNGTAVITENGKPAIDFQTERKMLSAGSVLDVSSRNIYQWSVYSLQTGAFWTPIIEGPLYSATNSNTYQPRLVAQRTSSVPIGNSSSALNVDQQYLRHDYADTSNARTFLDGDSSPVIDLVDNNSDWSTDVLSIGTISTTPDTYMKVSEVLLWQTGAGTVPSNRSGIETNIDTYFSIT